MRGNKAVIIFVILTIILVLLIVYIATFIKKNLSADDNGGIPDISGTVEDATSQQEIVDNSLNNTGANTSNTQVKDTSGKPTLASVAEIGDYVAYKPDKTVEKYTAESKYTGTANNQTIYAQETNWRVLGKNDQTGEIVLISEEPLYVGNVSGINTEFYLKGYNGYNNAVYLLNDICKTLYSKQGIGTARSINIEDIELISEFVKTTDATYGKEIKLTQTKYPIIAQTEEGVSIDSTDTKEAKITQSEQKSLTEGMNTAVLLSVKTTSYSYLATSYVKSPYDQLLLTSNAKNFNYWIASRALFDAGEGTATFEIFSMAEDIKRPQVTSLALYKSNGIEFEESNPIRPIVFLTKQTVCTNKDTADGEKIAWTIE